MTKNTIGSVSNWILGARQGDPVAIEEIVSRYLARVANCAQSMLAADEQRIRDGQDIATDVLMKMASELSSGQHQQLRDRNDLWVLLISIVNEQVVQNRNDWQQRNGVPQELTLTDYLSHCDQDLELLLSKGNKYGSLQAILDRMDDLIALVKDQQSKEVALLKLQGYSNRDIGARLGLVAKTVDRKVSKIISRWKQYLDNQGQSNP